MTNGMGYNEGHMKYDRVIAFHPSLARELDGIEEAIFYQQLYYWKDKGNREDGFIHKTIEDIEEETTLTRRQQDRIRAKLVKMGWIEIKKTHAPNGKPTLHYRCLVDMTICTKRTNGNVQKVQNHLYERDKCSIAEITTEITTDTLLADFEAFWEQYPRKTAKKAALLAWRRAKIAHDRVPTILGALANQKKSQQWTKDDGRFIPHAATWINQERWNDEPTSKGTPRLEKKYGNL